MVQKPKSYAGYQSDILAALVNSGIQQLAPGGKARALCDIVADQLGQLENRQFMNLGETMLPFATGTNLDVIGEIYGVPRIQKQAASVDSGDQNFRFYVRSGNFGDLNKGQDIVLPDGVRILTADDSGPVYLTSATTLPAAASQGYVSVRSLFSGSVSNGPARVFNRHNFTTYSESRFGGLLVTNDFGIVGGRDEEDDDSYRYRIHLKLVSPSGSNENALRFALLRLPGIQDVVFDRKSGTFSCYIYAVTPVAAASLLSMAQDTLDQTVAFPLTGTALNPDLVGVTLATTIALVAGSSQTDRDTAASQTSAAAQDYINNLRVGQPLIINDIAATIRNASPKILDVGQPNRQIEEIYIWRSRADASRYSRSLIANYSPRLGERIAVEDRVGAVTISAL